MRRALSLCSFEFGEWVGRAWKPVRVVLVVLTPLLSSCGPDEIPVDSTWVLGEWSTHGVGTPTNSLSRFEFSEDGRVTYFELSCASDPVVTTLELTWRVDRPDAVVIVDEAAGTILGFDHIRVTRDPTICDELIVEMIADGQGMQEFPAYRGQLCLAPPPNCTGSCTGCTAQWCDAEAPAC